jgi:hypothetical protein
MGVGPSNKNSLVTKALQGCNLVPVRRFFEPNTDYFTLSGLKMEDVDLFRHRAGTLC